MYRSLLVSGYKPHELGVFQEKHDQLPFVKEALKEKILAQIEAYAVEWIVISGQAGVELWAGEQTVQLRQEGWPVQLAVLAPFFEQEERFPEAVKALYEHVTSEADYMDYITRRPYDSPQQLRQKNEFLVTKTDAMLLLYDEEQEGTPRFYQQAAERRSDYPIIYMTPEDIEDSIRSRMDDWN
ncbi:SLOG family protein [Alkalicoccus chagannorensis]|uniref:SLOG family protein n=1 Tax=Alkalicoccus chagannorensis TaxID=427072 RepID=UPI000415CDF9|nr:SLOG family protein [Alkalicoccus chagannorensis]